MSNFDQFFTGLPISLYERPHRTSPLLAEDEPVVRLVPAPGCRGRGDGSSPAPKSHRGEPAFATPVWITTGAG
jgi:hypothetical protein